MLIGGEKYACDACVRGHRVSNCQHADRQLQHIAKKGRPVSQCTHCRTLRKARSAHVKCDCGDRGHAKGACPHMKEVEVKDICCCSHGGRCACALKKEHLDPVPESDSDENSSATLPILATRPRAHTVQSEGSGMTIFANGHHKPAQKHNQMAHKCGLPYTVPRAHSIHGPSPTGLANRSVDNLPHTSTIEALHGDSLLKDSMVSAQLEQRMIKSEHNSPIMGSSNIDQLTGQLPPLDLSNIDAYSDLNYPYSFAPLSAPVDVEPPIFSAGVGATSVDWSHYDGLDFNNDNFTTSEFSQAPSFTGFDFSSLDQPALTTTSTSGEISEVEDFSNLVDASRPMRPSLVKPFGSDFDTSDLGDDQYRLSTASSYMGMPQAQMLASNDLGALDIDDFIKGVNTSNGYVQPNLGMPNHGLSSTNYFDEPKFSQTNSPFEETDFQLPQIPLDEEALWMNNFDGNAGMSMNSSNSNNNNNNGRSSDSLGLNSWLQ